MREVMIKRIYTCIFVGVAASMLLFSCGKKKSKDGRTDTYSSGSVSFVADESFSPIIEEERDVFEATYPKAKVTPIYSNEVDGMNITFAYCCKRLHRKRKTELKRTQLCT